MLIGAYVAGQVYNRFLGGAKDLTLDKWQSFWWLPCAFAAFVLVFFALAFHDRSAAARGAESLGGATEPLAPPA
jgi:hypothetical protein